MPRPLEVTCPQCGKVYRNIPQELHGRRIRCRGCEATVPIPAPKGHTTDVDDGPAPRGEEEPRKTARTVRVEPVPVRPLKSARERLDEMDEEARAAKRKKRKKKKKGKWSLQKSLAEDWSLKRVYVALCITLCLYGWGLMAGRYAEDFEGWIPGVVRVLEPEQDDPPEMVRVLIYRKKIPVDYLKNAVAKIPRAPQVLWYGFTEVWHIPLGIAVVMALLGGAVYGASLLQKKHEAEDRQREMAGL
jgi:hypothetical protein